MNTRTEHRIRLCKEVASQSSEVSQTSAMAAGAQVTFNRFCCSAAYIPEACVMLVWDYGGQTEEVIWVSKGDKDLLMQEVKTAAGGEKIAIVLENSSAGPLWMSGGMMAEELST